MVFHRCRILIESARVVSVLLGLDCGVTTWGLRAVDSLNMEVDGDSDLTTADVVSDESSAAKCDTPPSMYCANLMFQEGLYFSRFRVLCDIWENLLGSVNA
eukprot:m.881587 g.881587  ORF g.881587 m.881587 type:complete len:101 (+) comp23596_c0_seq8:247-549(+)